MAPPKHRRAPSETAATREKLVDVAMRLFHAKGYNSTSVADILHEAGVNSGSLYYFFPGKQDLLIAVLDRYLQGIDPMLLQPAWRGVKDPIGRVLALLGAYRRFLVETDCYYGCPIGSLAMELHEPDPAVRKKLAANFQAWVRAVESCFEEARERFPRDLDLSQLAVFVLSVMEGAVMQARTHRSVKPFDASIARVRDYLQRLEEAARRKKPKSNFTVRP